MVKSTWEEESGHAALRIQVILAVTFWLYGCDSVQEADKGSGSSVIHLSLHCVGIGVGHREWVK